MLEVLIILMCPATIGWVECLTSVGVLSGSSGIHQFLRAAFPQLEGRTLPENLQFHLNSAALVACEGLGKFGHIDTSHFQVKTTYLH